MKNQKGITLIALIITIIVMLILAVVTVSFVIESKVIDAAKKAGDDTKAAIEAENKIEENSKIKVDGENVSVGEYMNNLLNPAT